MLRALRFTPDWNLCDGFPEVNLSLPVEQRDPNLTNTPLLPYIYTQTPESDHYTTPTPSFPIFRDFPTFPLKFERDFCIQTPIFRWTPLPEPIPSRRNPPIFSHFLTLRDPHVAILHYTSTQNNHHAINIEPPQFHISTSPHLISTQIISYTGQSKYKIP